jgi:hypothetical protein
MNMTSFFNRRIGSTMSAFLRESAIEAIKATGRTRPNAVLKLEHPRLDRVLKG